MNLFSLVATVDGPQGGVKRLILAENDGQLAIYHTLIQAMAAMHVWRGKMPDGTLINIMPIKVER